VLFQELLLKDDLLPLLLNDVDVLLVEGDGRKEGDLHAFTSLKVVCFIFGIDCEFRDKLFFAEWAIDHIDTCTLRESRENLFFTQEPITLSALLIESQV
jgi:hypothetical protein